MPDQRLSLVQRLIRSFVSAETFTRYESESRAWRMTCPACGHSRSIWELGGIRAGAAGNPRSKAKCPACRMRGWHRITRD